MPRTARTPVDPVCAAAVEAARAAAEAAAGDPTVVGEHLGAVGEGPRAAAHAFACRHPAYRGWSWTVVTMRAPRARHATVGEVVLLPGAEALLAPAWVPWSERVRPGDLGPGDRLPTTEDDERLVPTYLLGDDPETDPGMAAGLAVELGHGRRRVMSRSGRRDAADRWHSGDLGPDTRMARSAPDRCGACGFFLPLAGWIGGMVGVCGNGYASADGRAVTVDHGCGAHSEGLVEPARVTVPPVAYDDWRLEFVHRATHHPKGSVSDAEPAEPLGHG